MRKYKCLDLYCGGGGASLGYLQAGFDVTGVDIVTQHLYKGKFIKSDAIVYLLEHGHEYDFIHASPPCQAYSVCSAPHRAKGVTYPDLVDATRDALLKVGKPFVMENVEGAPMKDPIRLCGTMFDLPVYRHRLFESNVKLIEPQHKPHTVRCSRLGYKSKRGEFITYAGHFADVKKVRELTGLWWLGVKELAQSIPPQYTKYIGEQIIKYLDER